MNKETFLKIAPYMPKDAKPHNDDYIYCTRIFTENYEYDYSHAIVSYMKACGCVVKRTNNNVFGGFYIYYLKPTKYVDPTEFIESYKGGTHFDTRTKGMMVFLGCLAALTVLVLIVCSLFGG